MAIGDTIYVRCVVSLVGYGERGDVVQVVETAEVDQLISAGWLALSPGPQDEPPPLQVVLTSPQSLTVEQQAQARANIGVQAPTSVVDNGDGTVDVGGFPLPVLVGGVVPHAQLPADMQLVDNGDNTGTLGGDKLPLLRGDGTLDPAQIPATSGLLPAARWDALPTPFMIAHRGGALLAPEHSEEAYRACVAQGIHVIEQDLQVLADGAFGVMHDSTVDRITNQTGNCADMSSWSWEQLVVDVATNPEGGWFTTTPRLQLWSDVMRRWGNKARLCPEIKNSGTGAQVLATLQEHGIDPATVVVQSFYEADLDLLVAGGYDVMLLTSGALPDINNAVTKGYLYLAPEQSIITQAFVTDAHAAGRKVVAWTVDRRVDRDRLLGYGVDALFSNDPAYLQDDRFLRKTDPFKSGTWWPGQQSNPGTGIVTNRGKFYTGGYWGQEYDGVNNGTQAALHGYLEPTDPNNYELSYTMNLSAQTSSTRWGGVFLGLTDAPFTDVATPGVSGYHCLMRQNGSLDIYYVADNASAVQIGTFAGAARTAGTDYPFKITVSPTQLTLERTNNTDKIIVTDQRVRPLRYVNFTHAGATIKWKGVTIT